MARFIVVDIVSSPEAISIVLSSRKPFFFSGIYSCCSQVCTRDRWCRLSLPRELIAWRLIPFFWTKILSGMGTDQFWSMRHEERFAGDFWKISSFILKEPQEVPISPQRIRKQEAPKAMDSQPTTKRKPALGWSWHLNDRTRTEMERTGSLMAKLGHWMKQTWSPALSLEIF